MTVPYQEFPPDLRRLTPRTTALSASGDPGSSIEGINTNDLPDGAICFAQDVGLDYRFLRESSDAPVGDTVIEPSAGPGRWLKLDSSSTFGIRSVQLVGDTPNVTADVWTEETWSSITEQVGAPFGGLTAGQFVFTEGGLYLVTSRIRVAGGSPTNVLSALTCTGQLAGPATTTPAAGVVASVEGAQDTGNGLLACVSGFMRLRLTFAPAPLFRAWLLSVGTGGTMNYGGAFIAKLGD